MPPAVNAEGLISLFAREAKVGRDKMVEVMQNEASVHHFIERLKL
jgi:hypothetical protein